MTASGTPRGDDTGPAQEGIWEGPRPATDTRSSVPPDGLAGRLTSTVRTPGPAGLLLADVPNRIIALVLAIIVLSVFGFALAWLFGGLVIRPGAIDST
ncbi:MAG: hypothetical protein AB1Z66_05775, partial [Candidatus Limnocylindrales bacterium]